MRNVETLSGSVLAVLQCGGPTVRGAEVPGGKGCLKKRMPAAERQQESGTAWPIPPLAVSYNWPDTGPGARARKGADVRQVSR